MALWSKAPEGRPDIEVPTAAQDALPLTRIGGLATAGFFVGLVWPAIVGWQLVPRAPVDETADALPEPSASASASAQIVVRPSPTPGVALAKPVPLPEETAPEDKVIISKPIITSCEDEKGRKKDVCDDIDFDSVALARIRALSTCEAAKGLRGTLSAGFDLDFEKKKVTDYHEGKSTTFKRRTTKKLMACLRKEFSPLGLGTIKHENSTYTIFYKVELGRALKKAEDKDEGIQPAKGTATVAWGTALIRSDSGKKSDVVARLMSGTRVVVTGRRGDWYRVKYNGKGDEGWVYKGAIGL